MTRLLLHYPLIVLSALLGVLLVATCVEKLLLWAFPQPRYNDPHQWHEDDQGWQEYYHDPKE